MGRDVNDGAARLSYSPAAVRLLVVGAIMIACAIVGSTRTAVAADQQSLIRLLLYANDFELEGLIASSAGTLGELKDHVVHPELIREIVDAYGVVRPRLAIHADGYPEVEELRTQIKSGNPLRGREVIGDAHDTEGSQWIVRQVDRGIAKNDPRPLCISVWGGQTDLAQALCRVRADRGEKGLHEFVSRLRIYDINDQDRIGEWMRAEFPGMFYVLADAPKGRDKREGAYRGMYLGGDESLTSLEWLHKNAVREHGPLGALYPLRTWTAPNPHSALKEGDTPAWFYFLRNGLQDAAHPEWGGWGGRFERREASLYRDARDAVGKVVDARSTVSRWRADYQADFQARLDWCVGASRADANHPPQAIVDGDATRRILRREAQAAELLTLSASASRDSDHQPLRFRWWTYDEPSGGLRPELSGADTPTVSFRIPATAPGRELHLIVEVRDTGEPPLVAYRRVVIQISAPRAP